MKRQWLCCGLLAGLVACATTTSPTGRTQYVGAVGQQQLDSMGAKAFADVKAKTPLARDPRQQREVRCVVDAIVAVLPAAWRQHPWDVAVFQDDEPNAFALPGGKVGVNSGIFRVAHDQDQLAAVLAHEIGHVVARHHDERITRRMQAELGLGVVGAVAGARYGQEVAGGVVRGGSAVAQAGFLLPNSREQETEADIVGQRLMADAGFDPRQAVALWENMLALGGPRPPQWLSTHPDPRARIRELRSRAEQLRPTWQQARSAGHVPHCD